ncbi:MAG TPA: hypothetical protein VKV19_03025 [Ktedonobacteraceae bacterium]|nr:hypothetical protein [Ktedonobacteraceae bacterium]
MLDLSPDLKREFDAIAEQHEMTYALKEFEEYEIGVNWAAATVQRLKMLYADSPVVYGAFVASCQNANHPPQDDRIGRLDYEQALFIANVTKGLSGSEFVAMSLPELLIKALDICFD